MKRVWVSVAVTLLLAAVLAGCTAAQPPQVQSPDTSQTPTGFDAESTTPSSDTGAALTPDTSSAAGQIDEETAKQIALNHAGVKAEDATFVKCKLDYEDGCQVYELEWYANGNKYEYDVTAADGTILSASYESTMSSGTAANGAAVSEDAAKQTALSKVSGATPSDLYEWEFDYDDGRPEYEGKIIYGGVEYEFTIDATTGTITEWDMESLNR